jgi:O-antigen ligase
LIRVAIAAAILGFAPWILEPLHAFKAVVLLAIGLPLLVWVVAEWVAGRGPRLTPLTWSVLAWVAVSALATVMSIAPHLSLAGEPSQREGLLTTLALAGIALATPDAHRDERDVRTTLLLALACGVAAAAYAQLQLAGLDPIRWQGEHTYGSVLRPAGPLGNPILLGIVLAAVLPVSLAWLASRRADAAWLVPAAALVAASLVMTLSRGAWLAAAAGAVVGAALACAAGGSPRRALVTTGASLAPALLLAAFRAAGPIAARLGEGAHGGSLEQRGAIARGALALWRTRPWLGIGPDAFGVEFPRVQEASLWRDEWIGVPTHAHSAALQVLATLGVAGVLAGGAWLVTVALAWRRAWREQADARGTLAAIAGMLGALLVAGATNVVGLAGATLFAACAALPLALRPGPERAGGRLHPALPPIAMAAMLVFTIERGARECSAMALAWPLREPAPRGNATAAEWQAVTAARAATAWTAARHWPGEETLWRLASDASLAESDASPGPAGLTAALEAEGAARRALALVPTRAANVSQFANAVGARALRVGSSALADSAEAMFARATSMAPVDAWLIISRIRFELARRDGERALASARTIAALYPDAAIGHSLSGAALLLLGRSDEARAELLRARGAHWEEDAGEQRAALERLLDQIGPAGDSTAPRR